MADALATAVRAVVVGAGLAGLVAADELAHVGVEVVVLEARSRVGGRVWSEQLPNGAVVEMGAEFILPGNTAIRELVDRFELGLWDKGMRYGRRDPSGGIGTTHEELAAAVAEVERALAEAPRRARAHRRRDSRRASSSTASTSRRALARRSSRAWRYRAPTRPTWSPPRELVGVAHIDDEPAPGIAGGNQRLPLALAAELGDAVHLDSPVSAIEWGERVHVLTADGELDADACVIAVPASVLDRIAFDPPLPGPVADAFGLVATAMPRSCSPRSAGPPPPSAVMNVPERYWSWTAGGDGGRTQPVVSAFAGSARALEALRGRCRTGALARLARAAARRPRPGPRRGARLHLVGRPVGPGGLLHLAAAVRGPGGGGDNRPARVRGRAHRRAPRRADGGRYPERAARRSLADAASELVISL